jgi:hypothetical protein
MVNAECLGHQKKVDVNEIPEGHYNVNIGYLSRSILNHRVR